MVARAAQLGDEHHAPAPQPLLGRGNADLLDLGDLSHRQALDVVEHDGRAVGERQAQQGVLQPLAHLRPLDDDLRIDRVAVVLPQQLDPSHGLVGDVDRVVVASPAVVDGEVVQDAVQPRPDRRLATEGLGPLESAHDRVLHQVLGLTRVAHERSGVAQQAGDLGGQLLRDGGRRGQWHVHRFPGATSRRTWSTCIPQPE